MEIDAKSLEAAARALCSLAGINPDTVFAINEPEYEGGPSNDLAIENWSRFSKAARAAISAFLEAERAAGRRMMPREATTAMRVAGNRFGALYDSASMAGVWAAMWDAGGG